MHSPTQRVYSYASGIHAAGSDLCPNARSALALPIAAAVLHGATPANRERWNTARIQRPSAAFVCSIEVSVHFVPLHADMQSMSPRLGRLL